MANKKRSEFVTTPVMKVPGFQTSDGRFFSDSEEADDHQLELDVDLYLQQNPLTGNCAGSKVESGTLMEWLLAHEPLVCRILGREY